MQNRFCQLGVHRPDSQLEVGNELTLIAPLILNDAAVNISAQVIHDELPFASKIP